MLTANEIHAIFTRPEASWRMNMESPITHTFAQGYVMLSTLTNHKTTEQLHLVIHEDGMGEIQTFTAEELPGLMEEHVKQLGRMGFYFCEATKRISYKLVPKNMRTT